MIRVLIADDEPLARRGLEQLLASHPDCQVVAACRNGPETVRALNRGGIDVAFLDINMPGLNGFDVLEVADVMPVVVFVTAYDEFAVRAFEARALDYLLKPIKPGRFDDTLQRVRETLRSRNPPVLAVPTANGDLLLDAAEIDWIEADDYYAIVHAGDARHLIRESLRSLEQRLDPHDFVRVHRSGIVRIDRIRELLQDAVVLRGGTRIPVSRRRRLAVSTAVRQR